MAKGRKVRLYKGKFYIRRNGRYVKDERIREQTFIKDKKGKFHKVKGLEHFGIVERKDF